jgi:hypothetical protein
VRFGLDPLHAPTPGGLSDPMAPGVDDPLATGPDGLT